MEKEMQGNDSEVEIVLCAWDEDRRKKERLLWREAMVIKESREGGQTSLRLAYGVWVRAMKGFVAVAT